MSQSDEAAPSVQKPSYAGKGKGVAHFEGDEKLAQGMLCIAEYFRE